MAEAGKPKAAEEEEGKGPRMKVAGRREVVRRRGGGE